MTEKTTEVTTVQLSAAINTLAQEIHKHNVDAGWWPENTCMYTKLQLTITEVSEATEGERKNLMDDKLPHRKMGEVELADTFIRALDVSVPLQTSFDYDHVFDTAPVDTLKTWDVGRLHFKLSQKIAVLGTLYEMYDNKVRPYDLQAVEQLQIAYSNLIHWILLVAKTLGYDLMAAVEEKRKFNANREDHKLENRNKEHGKKF